jgi:hypothetical protein
MPATVAPTFPTPWTTARAPSSDPAPVSASHAARSAATTPRAVSGEGSPSQPAEPSGTPSTYGVCRLRAAMSATVVPTSSAV